MNKKHLLESFFEHPILSVSTLQGGLQHQTELIELADGKKWVCKQLNSHTWLGKIPSFQYQFTAQIASQVANQLGYTSPHEFIRVGQTQILLIPYCEGNGIKKLSKEQAFLLGKILADLHRLNLPKTGAKPFPRISLPSGQFYPAWLKTIVKQCNASMDYDAHNWVVSHRDIHLENIIWQTTGAPHLIDWESAGLTHPFIELMGLTNNSSGLANQQFDNELFQATLAGYAQANGRLPAADETLWRMSLHSWLLWYAYSLSRNWFDDAKYTLQTIGLIQENMTMLQAIYSELSQKFNRGYPHEND